MGIVGFYQGLEELSHGWKYGDINLWINQWNARRSLIPCG